MLLSRSWAPPGARTSLAVWNTICTVAASVLLAATTALAATRYARRRRRSSAGETARLRRRLCVRVGSSYGDAVIREAASRCGFVVDSSAPCQWADHSLLDWDLLLAEDSNNGQTQEVHAASVRRASCLYARSGLVRKAALAHRLMKCKVEGVLPPGLVADLEDEDDLEDLRKRLLEKTDMAEKSSLAPIWIAKASCANRGEQLFLAATADEVVTAVRPLALEQGVAEWVVQRYIASPMLIQEGCKFHIRAHFVVSGCPRCGTSRAWVHQQHNVMLVAGAKYAAGDFKSHMLGHLTNHCVQVEAAGFCEERQILRLGDLDSITHRDGLTAEVLRGIEAALAEVLTAVARDQFGFSPLPQCFELLGADFLLEDRGPAAAPGVWLLEVNSGPDLAVFGEGRLRSSCVELVEDVLRLAVEPQVLGNCSGRCSSDRARVFRRTASADRWPARALRAATGGLLAGCRATTADSFTAASACDCCVTAASGTGFGDCIWSAPPRTRSASQELASFKRRISIAGSWVKAMHDQSGVAVAGPQGQVRAAQAAAAEATSSLPGAA
eukprot:gnl/TRDRNA2_/TRDRNA2_177527_c0_seq2.p1 gnl/TRDRNA2_/TRDRNA2_177527_c0~~gnl/TRDRNA2_/TRDRNA2_177527_c0_seq2.p1  ORF type:complete len:555 (-),score=88.40 gnl/TRDRNA2_/TRDRNA2_177527_c0_seq2:128-1792(-)